MSQIEGVASGVQVEQAQSADLGEELGFEARILQLDAIAGQALLKQSGVELDDASTTAFTETPEN